MVGFRRAILVVKQDRDTVAVAVRKVLKGVMLLGHGSLWLGSVSLDWFECFLSNRPCRVLLLVVDVISSKPQATSADFLYKSAFVGVLEHKVGALIYRHEQIVDYLPRLLILLVLDCLVQLGLIVVEVSVGSTENVTQFAQVLQRVCTYCAKFRLILSVITNT